MQEWPDGDLRHRAFVDLAIAAADRDPTLAANIAATQTQAGPQQNRTVIGVVQRWAQTDRASTLAWVESFPAIDLREEALLAITSVSIPSQ